MRHAVDLDLGDVGKMTWVGAVHSYVVVVVVVHHWSAPFPYYDEKEDENDEH
jgi:hypothetical protein